MTHDGGHRRIRYIKNLQPPLEGSSISLVLSQDRSNRFRFHSDIVVCLIVAILATEANVGIVAAFGTVVTDIGKGSSNTNRGLFYPRITSPSTESYRGIIYDPHCCVTSQVNSRVFMAKDIMSNTDSSESICPTEHFRLGYASDVEGHWDYFLEYVQRSNVLDWEDVEKESDFNSSIADSNDASHDTKFQKLALRPNTHFIYGGGKFKCVAFVIVKKVSNIKWNILISYII